MRFAKFFIAVLAIIYVWNVFQYTTHWAYDGGAHLDYITSISEHRLPTPDDNYLAWHEPLYYVFAVVLAAPFGADVSIQALELVNALCALLFVMGAGTLSYLVSKRKDIALFVLVCTGSLFVVSALGRYVTNEMVFHTMTIWFFVLFWHWKMYERKSWTKKRWILLSVYLSVLMWVKLSAVIVIAALLLWLMLTAAIQKKVQPVMIGLCILIACTAAYMPWFLHKKSAYGEALTINSYEQSSDERMPLSFYTNLDLNIFRFPFYTSGNRSFWSMLYASTFGDYDNIFQNYEANQHLSIQTSNGRWISHDAKEDTLFVYVLALPLALAVVLGLLIHMFFFVQKRGKTDTAFLTIATFGFLGALMYNTYMYPHLERGTLKALFILSFFPLAFLLSFQEFAHIPVSQKKRRLLLKVVWVYVCVFSTISLGVLALPA